MRPVPEREVTSKRLGCVLELLHSLAAGVYERALPSAFEAADNGGEATPPTDGQVLRAVPGDRSIQGGWRRERRGDPARAFGAAARGAVRGLVRGG